MKIPISRILLWELLWRIKKTKLKFSIFIILGVCSLTSYSQTLIVKAGPNLSYANTQNHGLGDTYKIGYHLGISYEHHFSDILSIEPGLILEQKGFVVEKFTSDFNTNLYYANVPLLVKGTFEVDRDLKIFAAAGSKI